MQSVTVQTNTMNTQNSASVVALTSATAKTILPASPVRTVKSRFGNIEINTDRAIYFPQGLMGIPGNLHFCVTDYPSTHLNQYFRLFQCVESEDLCFIVMPHEHKSGGLIEANDMEEALGGLNIQNDNSLMLLIVSVHEEAEGIRRLSVNLRAPLLINIENFTGVQYVFPHTKYAIRHMIS